MTGERIKATVSAHAMLVDRNHSEGARVLLVRLAYRDYRAHKWALPGGFVDVGESLEGALVREVWEELGVRLLNWQQVKVETFLIQDKPHIGFVFRCDVWEGEPQCVSHELEELAWFDEKTFWNACREGSMAYQEMHHQVDCLGWRCGENGRSEI